MPTTYFTFLLCVSQAGGDHSRVIDAILRAPFDAFRLLHSSTGCLFELLNDSANFFGGALDWEVRGHASVRTLKTMTPRGTNGVDVEECLYLQHSCQFPHQRDLEFVC